ncbi:MAG: hypothetical protein AAFR21_03375 [Pseudomonadota bacterium]
MAFTFNSDLFLSEEDRAKAKKEYPSIFPGLDHASLRELFAPIDERAGAMKTKSRRWGVFAVFMAAIALILAGAEVLYHDWDKNVVRGIALVGAIFGIASVLIGVFGVMFQERKMRWLRDRLATERMRQFHFQHFVSHADEIVKSASDTDALAAYELKREKDFDKFSSDVLDQLDTRLEELVAAEDAGDGVFFPKASIPTNENETALREYFSAYEKLRFDWQIGYCDYLLHNTKNFWKHAPEKQERYFSTIAMGCVLGILILHALVLVGAIAEIKWMKGTLVHVGAIVMAIIALAVRTLEEGFQPETEIERLRQYRMALNTAKNRFDASETNAGKIDAIIEVEKLAYSEMVLFLKTNYHAKFVM